MKNLKAINKVTGSIVNNNDNMTLVSILLLKHMLVEFILYVILVIYIVASIMYMSVNGYTVVNAINGMSNFTHFLFTMS